MKYATSILVALSAAGFSAAATTCNGYPELCTKLYSEVTVVGAHNSYTASNTNLAANQDYGVTQQLTDGVRLLQNQVHLQNGQLRLCHTSCLLYDGGLLTDYLAKVKTWMTSNPADVVTILLVNIDNQPVSSISAAYVTAGLDKLSYSPTAAATKLDGWPTYGSLIDAGTRLVTFMDNGAVFGTVPYIIDEFSNVWEDYFDVQTADGFNCTVQRSTGDPATTMFLINHYLYTTSMLFGGSTPIPDKSALPTTNAVSGTGSLGEEATQTCMTNHGRAPNFLLVDFYDWGAGSVFQVAASINGVAYSGKAIAAQNGTDSTAQSGGGSSTTSTTGGAAGRGIEFSAILAVVVGSLFGSIMMV